MVRFCVIVAGWIGSTDKEEMKNFGMKILTFEIALVQLCPRFAT